MATETFASAARTGERGAPGQRREERVATWQYGR